MEDNNDCNFPTDIIRSILYLICCKIIFCVHSWNKYLKFTWLKTLANKFKLYFPLLRNQRNEKSKSVSTRVYSENSFQ